MRREAACKVPISRQGNTLAGATEDTLNLRAQDHVGIVKLASVLYKKDERRDRS
jgi:hypothetical protein